MGSPSEPDFGRLLARISEGLESAGLSFMLIGGQAVLLHGEPRLTQDIDITLGVGPDALGRVLAACERGAPGSVRHSRGPDAYLERWALEFSSVPGKERMPTVLAELRKG